GFKLASEPFSSYTDDVRLFGCSRDRPFSVCLLEFSFGGTLLNIRYKSGSEAVHRFAELNRDIILVRDMLKVIKES
ncbi:hypothetical protein ACJMK2_034563, partial [Sinanodonta woodiana]